MTPKAQAEEIAGRAPLSDIYATRRLAAEIESALLAAKAEGLREGRAQAFMEAQQAIVAACTMCDGQGWTLGIETGDGHACDGTDESCAQNCPVPVPVQTQQHCEYCGRPVAAIAAFARADAEGASK